MIILCLLVWFPFQNFFSSLIFDVSFSFLDVLSLYFPLHLNIVRRCGGGVTLSSWCDSHAVTKCVKKSKELVMKLVLSPKTWSSLLRFASVYKQSISRLSHCLENKMALKEVSSSSCFGGLQKVFSHQSSELKCEMKFSVYLPSQAESQKVPVLYYLSGLTCTEQNFIGKGGAQKYADQEGIIIVGPDTSPRGVNIEGEDESWDFGSGAGFYINATESKWKNHYRMYSYVTKELPAVIQSNFPVIPDKMSITGHSMGGHGALICALKNPGLYKSVSAFAPICNPMACPWGDKAFTGYLGPNKDAWKEYDSCELVKKYSGPALDILIDQGTADQFYPHQLLPENLVEASKATSVKISLRMQEDYDHSYYFISTFMGDHVKHHAKYLKA